MAIPIRRQYFPHAEKWKNDDCRERREKLETLLTTSESHQGWFKLEMFQQVIAELAACEVHLEDLDIIIMSDPIGNKALRGVRSDTSTRVSALRKTLGIDADKMRKFMKGQVIEAPVDELPVVAMADKDHTE